MADSTTNLDTISTGQASKEVTANELFDAISPGSLFGRRASTTAGLTWGYYGGVINVGGTLERKANGTITLTNGATNYLEFDDTGSPAGVVKNTSGWTPGLTRLYKIVTAGGLVTSYEDWRTASVAGSTGPAPDAADVPIADAGGYFTGADVEAALQEIGSALDGIDAALDAQPVVAATFYPGAPAASALVLLFAAPAGIATLTAAAAIAGSSGKALTAATAQTDFDVRKNATTSANGTSVGTMRFAAAGTVPTFIAASGFTLTGGTDTLSVWAPATPDATLANISASLYFTR